VRVKIDPGKCEGHAVCASLVPEVFQIPEEGAGAEVAVDQLPPALEPAVRRAVMGCPEQAITVEG
jgi:ferredoxin